MSMNQNASADSASQEKSPYARVGAKLVDAGFSAIPCAPGLKVPGSYQRREWRLEYDWTRYADRLPTEYETEAWGHWPEAGVCIVLGGSPDAVDHVVAVDVDTTDERAIQAIRGILPESPVERTGSKGYAALYRAPPSLASATFDVDGQRAVDFLALGRQILVPPTVHPTTERPYVYTSMLKLEDLTPADLPRLPDDFVERMREALAPFGEVRHNVDRRFRDDDYCGPWSETNSAALDNLDAWLPPLGIQAERERDGSYRGPALWRGGDNPTSVSYDHRGIRDFKMNEGLTPIDVVRRAGVADTDWNADDWLRERLGMPVLQRVHFVFRRPAKPASSDPLDAIELGKDVDWTMPSGLLGRMAAWIETQMQNPNRELAALAALATITPVVGWRNLYSPTGCALNGYYAGLAGTAVGKDSMLKLPGRLLATVRIPGKRLYSSSDAFSLSGQEGIVNRSGFAGGRFV